MSFPTAISEIIQQYTYEHHVENREEYTTLNGQKEHISIGYYRHRIIGSIDFYHHDASYGPERAYDSKGVLVYHGYNRDSQFHGLNIGYTFNNIIGSIGIFHNGYGYDYYYKDDPRDPAFGTLREIIYRTPNKYDE